MDRTERFYKIDQLPQERRCVALEAMIEALGVSRATVEAGAGARQRAT